MYTRLSSITANTTGQAESSKLRVLSSAECSENTIPASRSGDIQGSFQAAAETRERQVF